MQMRSRTLESRTVSGERKDRLGELRGVSSPSWLVVGLADIDTVEVQTFKYGLSSVRSGYNGCLYVWVDGDKSMNIYIHSEKQGGRDVAQSIPGCFEEIDDVRVVFFCLCLGRCQRPLRR